MKTIALITILLLHLSGLAAHISPHTLTRLTVAAGLQSQAALAPDASLTGALGPADITPQPVQTGSEAIHINATSAYAVDVSTGTVLYSQNAQQGRPIASLTKLVTTLVILSHYQLSDHITIPTLPAYQSDDQIIGIKTGEVYTVHDLLEALLINSDDDVADALARADAGSETKFAALMNAKMAEWGITGTHFSNPSGLQDTNNYATAQALGKIATLALTNSFVRTTVDQSSATISSSTGRQLQLTTTDDLLASGQFYGIKTGYTPGAGECFVGLTHINGHEVVTVVLNADDRFAATSALTAWVGRNWQWI